MNSQPSNVATNPDITEHLRRLASKMPGAVKFRLLSALEHFDRASVLLEADTEMASFRAITGEEEAATALIKAIQLRRYPDAHKFNARDHVHKAAVNACVLAIATQVAPILSEFQLTFDFQKRRVDIKIPLSNFNVTGGESLAIQLVEPLDLTHTSEGQAEATPFERALESLATRANYENIKKLVAAQANARNTLLYASDSTLPRSQATTGSIETRKNRALTMLVLSAMVLQSRKHLSLVCQAITAFLAVISRLSPDQIDSV